MVIKILHKYLRAKEEGNQREQEITKRELEVCVSRNPMAQELLKEILKNDKPKTRLV